MNGDNKLDAVVTNLGSNNVGVLLGDGAGAFGGVTTYTGTGMNGPHGIASGDFNGDGKQDVVVTNYNGNTVQPLLGDGTGKLTAGATIGVGVQPIYVALADINGDAKLDLVSGDAGSFTMSIRLGNGIGGFTGSQSVQNGTGAGSVRILDVNQDGQLDLVNGGNGTNNKVSVYPGNGTGLFGGPTTFTVGATPGGLVFADFNRDGRIDLVSVSNGPGLVAVLLGDGQGSFAGAPSATNFGVGFGPLGVVATDLNGDGNQDIVTTDANGASLSVLLAVDQCK